MYSFKISSSAVNLGKPVDPSEENVQFALSTMNKGCHCFSRSHNCALRELLDLNDKAFRDRLTVRQGTQLMLGDSLHNVSRHQISSISDYDRFILGDIETCVDMNTKCLLQEVIE